MAALITNLKKSDDNKEALVSVEIIVNIRYEYEDFKTIVVSLDIKMNSEQLYHYGNKVDGCLLWIPAKDNAGELIYPEDLSNILEGLGYVGHHNYYDWYCFETNFDKDEYCLYRSVDVNLTKECYSKHIRSQKIKELLNVFYKN